MPTPVGHSLAGYAAAKLTRVRLNGDDRILFLFAGFVAIIPDVLGQLTSRAQFSGAHGFSHSLVALALVSVVAASLGVGFGFRFWPLLLLVAAAYGSHLFADLLRPEPTAEAGEQILWPLSQSFGVNQNILPHVPHRWVYGGGIGWVYAVAGLALREVLVLGPVAVIAHFIPARISARGRERA